MKEITLARIILANLEPQVDYVIEKATEINEHYNQLQVLYNQLQTLYNDALKLIEELNNKLTNGRQNSNTLEST